MFESQTYETILARLLARAPSTLDKREGSVIYDALAPEAAELATMYTNLDAFLNETFADTASRKYLIRRAAERDLTPEEATYTVAKATFSPVALVVLGDRFSADNLNFVVTQVGRVAVATLTVTGGASAAGDITVTLGDESVTVAVLADDTTAVSVALRIRATEIDGWTVTGSGAEVIFTCDTCGENAVSFEDTDDTGVTASINQTVDGCDYQLSCETAGEAGNAYTGKIIPIEYINGLQTANLDEILIPGEDEEGTEVFRERYLNSFQSIAFGGNVADYEEKVKALDGVGGVAVTPVWNGGGTVRLAIIASDYTPPTDTLIDAVQEEVDPTDYSGEGVGLAPIGHVVTVAGVVGIEIVLAATLTYQSGWSWDATSDYVLEAIDEYYLELAQVWEETRKNGSSLVVRISQLESRILDCAGILDIADTTINGNAANLALGEESIPVRGTFNGA